MFKSQKFYISFFLPELVFPFYTPAEFYPNLLYLMIQSILLIDHVLSLAHPFILFPYLFQKLDGKKPRSINIYFED